MNNRGEEGTEGLFQKKIKSKMSREMHEKIKSVLSEFYYSMPDKCRCIDCQQNIYSPIATPISKGQTFFIINEKYKIGEIKPGKIFLPKISIDVIISDVTKSNVEEKYNEAQQKIKNIRYKFLIQLKETWKKSKIVSPTQKEPEGQGLYYSFLVMSQNVENDKILFTEKFSAVWAEKLINKLDTMFTVHGLNGD